MDAACGSCESGGYGSAGGSSNVNVPSNPVPGWGVSKPNHGRKIRGVKPEGMFFKVS